MAERVLICNFDATALTAVADLLSLKNSATNGLELRGFSVSAASISTPTTIRLRLKRVTGATVTQGSGGSVLTPVMVDTGIGAVGAKATAHACDTTQATGTTVTTLMAWEWNMLQDLLYIPVSPDEREAIGVSELICVDLGAAPAAGGVTFSGWIKYAEYP